MTGEGEMFKQEASFTGSHGVREEKNVLVKEWLFIVSKRNRNS